MAFRRVCVCDVNPFADKKKTLSTWQQLLRFYLLQRYLRYSHLNEDELLIYSSEIRHEFYLNFQGFFVASSLLCIIVSIRF